jgi:glycerophosphoryl diester phosphodiesterase
MKLEDLNECGVDFTSKQSKRIAVAFFLFWWLPSLMPHVSADPPIVIAHRGASGYLPEHTLAAKAMAYACGAEYLEQDVVLTADDQPIVLHDIYVDTVTNVSKVFPGRHRADGRYHAIDLTLSEIRRLEVTERIDRATGQAVFQKRFPVGASRFFIPTLAEEIELVQGLNKATGRQVGIYPEIKLPSFHRACGKDISRIVLKTLADYGYVDRHDRVFLQCFDADELKRIRNELSCRLKIIQLISDDEWDVSKTGDALRAIAQYADGIGPPLSLVLDNRGHDGSSQLVQEAHELGLVVHPYTFRVDALPPGHADATSLLRSLFDQAKIDGLFSDFPDVTKGYLQRD